MILICVTGINNFSSRKNAGNLKYRQKSLLVARIRRFFSLWPALRSFDFDEGALKKVDQHFKVPTYTLDDDTKSAANACLPLGIPQGPLVLELSKKSRSYLRAGG